MFLKKYVTKSLSLRKQCGLSGPEFENKGQQAYGKMLNLTSK